MVISRPCWRVLHLAIFALCCEAGWAAYQYWFFHGVPW